MPGGVQTQRGRRVRPAPRSNEANPNQGQAARGVAMEAYRNVAGLFNLAMPPALPRLVRSYEQRLALFTHHNPRYKHGRGTARRQSREYYVRDVMLWRAALLGGDHVRVGKHRLRATWRELVHAPLAKMTAATTASRTQARHLMGLLVEHGPWNGWGIDQPPRSGPGEARATPYAVPKASEKCWRWWRHVAQELGRLLLHLDVLRARAIPLHGTPVELPPRGERQSFARPSPREDGTGYRDRS